MIGNKTVFQQITARLLAEARHIQRRTRNERPQSTDGMNATDKAPHPLQRAGTIQFGSTPAVTRKNRKTVAVENMQRGAVCIRLGAAYRYFALDQFGDKSI